MFVHNGLCPTETPNAIHANYESVKSNMAFCTNAKERVRKSWESLFDQRCVEDTDAYFTCAYDYIGFFLPYTLQTICPVLQSTRHIKLMCIYKEVGFTKSPLGKIKCQ